MISKDSLHIDWITKVSSAKRKIENFRIVENKNNNLILESSQGSFIEYERVN
jgi:hypothetical protein